MSRALTSEGKKVFPRLKKFEGFYLAGGTALAIQISHRISIDFDLFSPNEIEIGLLEKIAGVFAGRKIEASVNNSDELTVFIDGVKITFLHYPFKVYSDFIEDNALKILTPKQIAYTKAYSIGRRGLYKDYVDLYFIFQKHSLQELMVKTNNIFKTEFNEKLFRTQLAYFEDIDYTEEIKYMTGFEKEDKEIKQYLEKISLA